MVYENIFYLKNCRVIFTANASYKYDLDFIETLFFFVFHGKFSFLSCMFQCLNLAERNKGTKCKGI